jgi:hypothetical protein
MGVDNLPVLGGRFATPNSGVKSTLKGTQMSLVMTATLRRVADSPAQEKNKDTGEVSNIWSMQFEHARTNGEIELFKIQAKSDMQASGWRRVVGKQVSFPVNVIANGGYVYYWLDQGQLPAAVAYDKSAA